MQTEDAELLDTVVPRPLPNLAVAALAARTAPLHPAELLLIQQLIAAASKVDKYQDAAIARTKIIAEIAGLHFGAAS